MRLCLTLHLNIVLHLNLVVSKEREKSIMSDDVGSVALMSLVYALTCLVFAPPRSRKGAVVPATRLRLNDNENV
jgi:membrane-anchored protein YejM (alkaline phosphatase superfamily)